MPCNYRLKLMTGMPVEELGNDIRTPRKTLFCFELVQTAKGKLNVTGA